MRAQAENSNASQKDREQHLLALWEIVPYVREPRCWLPPCPANRAPRLFARLRIEMAPCHDADFQPDRLRLHSVRCKPLEGPARLAVPMPRSAIGRKIYPTIA